MKLKTRTNQPVYYKLPVSSNIQSLSDDLLNSLRVGDVVQKKTGNQKHCYIVSYKEEKHGICLTYVDGSGYMETISYDYTDGHWVFNSKDVKEVLGKNEDIQVNGITSKGIANTGAIGNIGNVAITGDLSASGKITGGEIVENMSGYSFSGSGLANLTYAGVVKTGNKLTFVLAGDITPETASTFYDLGDFTIPEEIDNKIYGINETPQVAYPNIDFVVSYASKVNTYGLVQKLTGHILRFGTYAPAAITPNTKYYFRVEVTFLLSGNLASQA